MRLEGASVRALGLGRHLPRRSAVEVLAGIGSLDVLAAELLRQRLIADVAIADVGPQVLDAAVSRAAAGDLRTLARWIRDLPAARAVLLEDEDRRNVRAMLRGARQGAPPRLRIAGLIATPDLDERRLDQLAEQSTVRGVVQRLQGWGSPYGAALSLEATERQSDLLLLETTLNRAFASRSLRAARKAGRALRDHITDLIDLENAWSALLLGSASSEVPEERLFVDGGRHLSRDVFLEVVGVEALNAKASALNAGLGGSVFAGMFGQASIGARALERHALMRMIDKQRRARRLDPVGPAALILFALRLRAKLMDLRRVIWARALGAPAAGVVAELVSPR